MAVPVRTTVVLPPSWVKPTIDTPGRTLSLLLPSRFALPHQYLDFGDARSLAGRYWAIVSLPQHKNANILGPSRAMPAIGTPSPTARPLLPSRFTNSCPRNPL